MKGERKSKEISSSKSQKTSSNLVDKYKEYEEVARKPFDRDELERLKLYYINNANQGRTTRSNVNKEAATKPRISKYNLEKKQLESLRDKDLLIKLRQIKLYEKNCAIALQQSSIIDVDEVHMNLEEFLEKVLKLTPMKDKT
jgi:hypothetical protein